MNKPLIVLLVAFYASLIGLSIYATVTFYSYPCEAFKTGYLSIGYAPARCIE